MPAISVSLDFSVLPAGVLPVSCQLGGITFTSAVAVPSPRIATAVGEQGYRFTDLGVVVILPSLCNAVDLRVCTGATQVSVEALSQRGTMLTRRVVPPQQCQDVRLLAQQIASLNIVGGNDEACLARIAVAFDCRPEKDVNEVGSRQ